MEIYRNSIDEASGRSGRGSQWDGAAVPPAHILNWGNLAGAVPPGECHRPGLFSGSPSGPASHTSVYRAYGATVIRSISGA